MARRRGPEVKNITIESHKKEYLQALDKVAEAVLASWGMTAESSAKEIITEKNIFDTGLLRNSITWAVAGKAPHIKTYKAQNGIGSGRYEGMAEADEGGARHVYIGTNVEYAMIHEVGGAKIKARPYLRPAIDENRKEFKRLLEEALKEAMAND